MKKVFLFIAGAWMAWASHAEGNKGKWWQDIKQNTTFGGYVIGKAAFNDQDLDNKNESHSTSASSGHTSTAKYGISDTGFKWK